MGRLWKDEEGLTTVDALCCARLSWQDPAWNTLGDTVSAPSMSAGTIANAAQ